MSTLDVVKNRELSKLQSELPVIVDEYSSLIDAAPSYLTMKGKTIEQCLKEQASEPIVYADIKAELDTIYKSLNKSLDATRSRLYRNYVEQYSRTLSDRAIDKFIDGDDEVNGYLDLILMVKEQLDRASAVLNAFDTRGFALRDVTQIRINQLHKTLL
jgi:hypothetical protein